MKVVKWGVHGTGTCIGPGILLAAVAAMAAVAAVTAVIGLALRCV